MGYYLECKEPYGKAKQLIETIPSAAIATQEGARSAMKAGLGVICIIHYPTHEAAGFCFNWDEFEAFIYPPDIKQWVIMDRKIAEKLSGYSR